MDEYEWYDNYYCTKCNKVVHENHNIPKHDCVKSNKKSLCDNSIYIFMIGNLTGVLMTMLIYFLLDVI